MKYPLFTAAAAILAVACSSSTSSLPPFDGFLALGMWGGESAGMIVSDTAMHLHVGCTYGDVSGRVPLSRSGTFDVEGNYTLHAFPIAVGPTMPARFAGRIEGTSATVTATVDDTIQHKMVVLGPVVVTFARDPHDMPCPICRRPIITQTRSPTSLSRIGAG